MDGIIFDVDGTLWDSVDSVAEAWNHVIHKKTNLNIALDKSSLMKLFGKTMDTICETLFPELSPQEQKRIGECCLEYENKLLEQKPGTLYEGVTETFQELSGRTRLFIVSNCQRGYIEILLKAYHLEPYIKDFLCFGQTGTEKDATIRTLMERNGLKDVVYVGDTQGDADACQKAGVPFIFAEYGFGNVPDAKVRIRKITDLTEMF